MGNPVYSYRCETCRREHDRPGKMGEAPAGRVSCPDCGSDCYRVYRVPGVQYVGNGWTGAQRNRTARNSHG